MNLHRIWYHTASEMKSCNAATCMIITTTLHKGNHDSSFEQMSTFHSYSHYGLVSWYSTGPHGPNSNRIPRNTLNFWSKHYFMNLLAMLRRPPTPPEEPPEAPPPLPPFMYILSAICAAELTTSCLEEPLGALPLAFCWSVILLAVSIHHRGS